MITHKQKISKFLGWDIKLWYTKITPRFTKVGRAQLKHFFIMEALEYDQGLLSTWSVERPVNLFPANTGATYEETIARIEERLSSDYYENYAENLVRQLERYEAVFPGASACDEISAAEWIE